MTQEEAWYFRHNGFHRIARPLPRKLVARLNSVTDEQIATLAEPVVWETGTTSCTPQDVRRLSKILARDPVYLEAATHPTVLNALAGVLGDNIELLTNKHNHIMVRPSNSAPVPWHAGEELYEPTLITALIYLEESTIDNGCVHLVPGSHLRPFAKPRRPGGDFRRNPLYRRSLPVPMPAGGVLLFNDCCFHGADVNRSNGSRRSMTLGYCAHDSHDVLKDDPEKILVRGERAYTGHPHPFPNPKKGKKT